ncbi:MAG: paraquat-inducible protein A [Candidatus Omnitrophota bacterium]
MKNNQKKSLQEMFPRRFDIPVLIIFCAGLFCAGLSLPLLEVKNFIFWKDEYSVMSGVVGLFHDREYFLSFVIFAFSIIFPVIKLSTLWILWKVRFSAEKRQKVLFWLEQLGKWSMLDVFVVAIMIVAVKLGPLTNIRPRLGVYVFAAAILAAMLTTKWIEKFAARVANKNDQ